MFAHTPSSHTTQVPLRPCPACGSSHVTASSYKYDPKRGVVVNSQARSAGIWGLLTWVVGTFLLNAVLPYFFGSYAPLVAAIPFWVPLALAAVVMFAVTVVQEWRQTNAVRIDSYACRECGHEWSLRNGRPVHGKSRL